jgi:AbiV family abortive infection protein
VLEDEGLANIAYHLSVLALEEVGKASLVGMHHVAAMHGQEPGFVDKRLDDHVFKLFWALWTPAFARGQISREELESLQLMASRIHQTRLDAMYVAIPSNGEESLIAAIPNDEAHWIHGLAEARLGMEGTVDWEALDFSPGSDAHWFIQASDDPEKRKLIFGQPSFDKFAELEKVADWIAWLRAQFDQAELESQELMRRELERVVPGRDAPGDEKWQIRIRLHSPSQSIRNSAIGVWNAQATWIKLGAVQNDKHAIDVVFTLKEAVPIQAVAHLGYTSARMFLAGLNIGSTGFWWWHLSEHQDRFYERLVDLKAPPGADLGLEIHAWPKFEWNRQALKDPDFGRVAMCFGMIARLPRPVYDTIIEPYLTGLALLGKSDLHLNFGPHACERFTVCLLETMRHFGDWDGSDDAIAAAVMTAFAPIAQQADDLDDVIGQILAIRKGAVQPMDITLDRAAMFKVLCDVCLISGFEKMAASMAKPVVPPEG